MGGIAGPASTSKWTYHRPSAISGLAQSAQQKAHEINRF